MTAPVDIQIPAPALAPAASPRQASSWLTYEHPEYARMKARWQYARDFYTGEVIDPKKIETYLVRKASAENDAAYTERRALADYTNHFAAVVDSLVGMIFGVEGDANRVWNDDAGRGLGDPADLATPIGQLWRAADQEGNGYPTVFKLLATELVTTHTAWFFVDPANGSPRLRIIPATHVTNWLYDRRSAMLREAVVTEWADTRGTLRDAPYDEVRYLHLTPAGWARYRIGPDGSEEPVGSEATGDVGTWRFVSPEGGPALPLFRVHLPMRRHAGYLLARKANVIFNKESERDTLLRTAGFPKLVLSAGNELYERLVDALAAGSNVLQEDPANPGGGHRFIGPEVAAAVAATEVLKRKVEEFYVSAFRDYGDAAQQRTATEVRQDVSSGAGAFLQLLKAGLDDAENNALWRIEQALKPDDRRFWFIAHVERSDDFMPADPAAVMQRQAAVAFGDGKTVPLGKTGRLNIAKAVAAYQGVPVDDAEVEAEVELRLVLDTLAAAAGALPLEVPAEARVDLVMALLAAAGQIDAEAEVAMEDGTRQTRADVLRQQALALAQAADDAARLGGESFFGPPRPPGGGGAGGGGGTDPNPAPTADPGGAPGSGGAGA